MTKTLRTSAQSPTRCALRPLGEGAMFVVFWGREARGRVSYQPESDAIYRTIDVIFTVTKIIQEKTK